MWGVLKINRTIIIATRNQGKVREIAEALSDFPLDFLSISEWEKEKGVVLGEPVEDGETFQANSRIKAEYYAKLTNLPCLADDSGLEVEALGNRPGVYSSRFAGEKATDADNNAKLVAELTKLGLTESKASYKACITVLKPSGESITAEGVFSGTVRTVAQGNGGFGYDPLFYIEANKTVAELSLAEKHRISHRGKALDELKTKLGEFIGAL